MDFETISALSVIALIVLVILIYVCILPDRRYAELGSFGKWLANLFKFKTLWLESILRFFYIVLTVWCVVFGFFILFAESYWGESYTSIGFTLMLAGPIVVRIVYESAMMFILLVKNTMQINNRLEAEISKRETESKSAMHTDKRFEAESVKKEAGIRSTFQKASTPNTAKLDQAGFCESCGCRVGADTVYCPGCGKKVE